MAIVATGMVGDQVHSLSEARGQISNPSLRGINRASCRQESP